MLVKLKDIADVIISNVDKKIKENEKKVYLCNFTDVYNNYAITKKANINFMMASASKSQIDKFSIKKGYLAITKDSETRDDIGVGTFFADNFDNLLLGYHCALIKPNASLVNSKFLNAYIQSPFARKYYELNASGSGQRYTLTIDTIADTPIYLPPYDVQLKIGNLLSGIDMQIERNLAIVKRLQVLGHAIYKRWFIQFEYPNSNKTFVYNTELKRKIPIDWKVISLCDLMNKTNLASDKTINSPTIDLSVMPSSNISLINLNNSDNFSTNLNRMKEGNILFGSIRPYLKKCGIAPCDGNVAGTVYQFEVHQSEAYNYILMTMSQDFFFDYALKVSTGTRMPVVSADKILSYNLPYNENIVHLFNKLPIKKLIISINKNTNKLINLKDKLLPLLIDGQLK